jgi:hypothetical protein
MVKRKFCTSHYLLANFVIAFLLYAVAFGLSLILHWPFWIAILIILIATLLLSFWLYHSWLEAVLKTLLISEVAWVIYFLPLGYLTNATILLIIYYTIWEIRFKKKAFSILFFSAFLLFLLLITTQWSSK